jgi:hypothetical protein
VRYLTKAESLIEMKEEKKSPVVPKRIVYRVLRDFSASINSQLVHYNVGDMVFDFHTVSELLKNGCPIIAEDDATTVICPNCGFMFAHEVIEKEEE